MPLPTAQQVNLPACSPYYLFNAEREVVNTNFIVIEFTQLRIKPESTVPDAEYTVITRPSELLTKWHEFDSGVGQIEWVGFTLVCDMMHTMVFAHLSVPRSGHDTKAPKVAKTRYHVIIT